MIVCSLAHGHAEGLDVNGDGSADLVLNARPEPGYLFSYHGGATGLLTTVATEIQAPVGPHFPTFGANLGDLNGDGYMDLAASARYALGYSGQVYLCLGGPGGLATAPVVTIDNPHPPIGYPTDWLGLHFGNSLAAPGDVDGDGYADLIVGSFGAAYLFPGSAAGFSTTPMSSLTSPGSVDGGYAGDAFGATAGAAGDVNADGHADVVVGAYYSGNQSGGRAYLYYGGPTGLAQAPTTIVAPSPASWWFGVDFSSGDDLNGDGYADVVIAAPYSSSYTGAVHVYYGSPSGIAPTPALTLVGGEWSHFGRNIASVGDYSGDGYPDIAVTDRNNNVYVYGGGPSGLASSPLATLQGPGTFWRGGNFWYLVVEGAGDLNGDGLYDVAVTQPADGAVYVFYGGRTGLVASPDMVVPDPESRLSGRMVVGYDPQAAPLVLNQPPTADAGREQTVECTCTAGAGVTLDGTGSNDPDGDLLTFLWEAEGITFADPTLPVASATFPRGATTVLLTVADPSGEAAADVVVITVADRTPPAVSLDLSPAELWPPNHKMMDIAATITVRDACDGEPVMALASIYSNEPDNGLGDGDKADDIQDAELGTADLYFRLRAERSGGGSGREYVVTYTATDASGNSASASATVAVPKNKGNGKGRKKSVAVTAVASDYALHANMPNPFNAETTIRFELPSPEEVRLEIFDVLGRKIRVLMARYASAGSHQVRWDGRDEAGRPVSSGVFVYRLRAGAFVAAETQRQCF